MIRMRSAWPLVRFAVTAAPVAMNPMTAAAASGARHFSLNGSVNPSPESPRWIGDGALVGVDLGGRVVGQSLAPRAVDVHGVADAVVVELVGDHRRDAHATAGSAPRTRWCRSGR